MALNDTVLNIGGTAMRDVITHISLHTTGAVTSDADESTAARLPAGWGSVTSGGNFSTAAPLEFTGGAADGPVVRVGYWSALTGGVYYGGSLLTGDAAFNAAGEYTVTSITETGSAT